jgi:hypothetical protein
MIVMGKSKEILFQQILPAEAARNILSIGKTLGTTVVMWSNNKLYAYELNERVPDYKKISTVELIIIENEEEIIQRGITKILWYDYTEKLD